MFCGCISSDIKSVPRQVEAICSESGDVAQLKRLLKKNENVDVNFLTFNGYTPLHMSCQKNFPEVVSYLLEIGADPEFKAKNKDISAFHVACWSGAIECVRLLLQKEPGLINDITSDKYTGLHYGCWGGNLAVVTFLVSAGANITSKTVDGYTPLIIASRCGHVEILEYMINLAPPPVIYSRSEKDSSSNDLARLRSIGKKYCEDVNSSSNNYNNNNNNVSDLDNNNNSSKEHVNEGPQSPPVDSSASRDLYARKSQEQLRTSELRASLSNQGLSSNKKGNPFSKGWDDDELKVKVEDMLAIGDNHGCTALHHASWEGHVSCVRILLRYGCDPSAKDHRNRTPADLAKNRDIQELVKSVARGMLSVTRSRAGDKDREKEKVSRNAVKKERNKERRGDPHAALNTPSAFSAGNNSMYDYNNSAEFSPDGDRAAQIDGDTAESSSPLTLSSLNAYPVAKKNLPRENNRDVDFEHKSQVENSSAGVGEYISPHVDDGSGIGSFDFAIGGGRLNLVSLSSSFMTNNPNVVKGILDIICRKRGASNEEEDVSELMRLLVKYPAIPSSNIRDVNNRSLLILCVENGKLELLKVFVRLNIKLLGDTDFYGYNCFHIAVMKNMYHIAEYLIANSLTFSRDDYGPSLSSLSSNLQEANRSSDLVDINAKTCFGRTALHFACEFGNVEMVRLLTKKGNARLHVLDIDGLGPLHLAIIRDNCEVILHLLTENEYEHRDLMVVTKNGDMIPDLAKGRVVKNFLEAYMNYKLSCLNEEEYNSESNNRMARTYEKAMQALKSAVRSAKTQFSEQDPSRLLTPDKGIVDQRILNYKSQENRVTNIFSNSSMLDGSEMANNNSNYDSPTGRSSRKDNFFLKPRNHISNMIKTESGNALSFRSDTGKNGFFSKLNFQQQNNNSISSSNNNKGSYVEPNTDFKPLVSQGYPSPGSRSGKKSANKNANRSLSRSDSESDGYSYLRRALRNKDAEKMKEKEKETDEKDENAEGYKSTGSATSVSSILKSVVRMKAKAKEAKQAVQVTADASTSTATIITPASTASTGAVAAKAKLPARSPVSQSGKAEGRKFGLGSEDYKLGIGVTYSSGNNNKNNNSSAIYDNDNESNIARSNNNNESSNQASYKFIKSVINKPREPSSTASPGRDAKFTSDGGGKDSKDFNSIRGTNGIRSSSEKKVRPTTSLASISSRIISSKSDRDLNKLGASSNASMFDYESDGHVSIGDKSSAPASAASDKNAFISRLMAGYASEGSKYAESLGKKEKFVPTYSDMDNNEGGNQASYKYIKSFMNKPVATSVDNAASVMSSSNRNDKSEKTIKVEDVSQPSQPELDYDSEGHKSTGSVKSASRLSNSSNNNVGPTKGNLKAEICLMNPSLQRQPVDESVKPNDRERRVFRSYYDDPANFVEDNSDGSHLATITFDGHDLNRSVSQLPLVNKIQSVATRYDVYRIQVAFDKLRANAATTTTSSSTTTTTSDISEDSNLILPTDSSNPGSSSTRSTPNRTITSPLNWLQKRISAHNIKFQAPDYSHSVLPEALSLKVFSITASESSAGQSSNAIPAVVPSSSSSVSAGGAAATSSKAHFLSGGKSNLLSSFEGIMPCIEENEDCLWKLFNIYGSNRRSPSGPTSTNLTKIHYNYPVLSISGLWKLLKDVNICPLYCSKIQLQNHIWDSSCGVLYKTMVSRKSLIEGQQAIITFSHFFQILIFIAQQSKTLLSQAQSFVDSMQPTPLDKFTCILRAASASVTSIIKENGDGFSEGGAVAVSFMYLSSEK